MSADVLQRQQSASSELLSDDELAQLLSGEIFVSSSHSVKVKAAASTTPSIYHYTTRLTGSDVMSCITTVRRANSAPVPGKLLPAHSAVLQSRKAKELLRKAPLKTKIYVSPLEPAAQIAQLGRDRLNAELWAEEASFLQKLQARRDEQAALENYAATLIQAAFRRRQLRQRWESVKQDLIVRLRMRAALREELRTLAPDWVLTPKERRARDLARAQAAASTLQRGYRMHAARRRVLQRRQQLLQQQRTAAVTRLQCWVRCGIAAAAVACARQRAALRRRLQAALSLQCAWRSCCARRAVTVTRLRLKAVCAVLLQCCWRRHAARQRVQRLRAQRLHTGAVAVQRIVRGYMARHRVQKLLLQARLHRRLQAACTLQRCVRCSQAQRRVTLLRSRRVRCRRHSAVLHLQRVARGYAGRLKARAARRAAAVDIWHQVRRGDADTVAALCTRHALRASLGGSGLSSAADIRDPWGNTLLMVAARHGKMTVVRRLAQLGAALHLRQELPDLEDVSDDVEGDVAAGLTALELAVQRGHNEVASYLLSHPCNTGSSSGSGSSCSSVHRHALHLASTAGMHQLCAQLLAQDPAAVNSINSSRGSPLHCACSSGTYISAQCSRVNDCSVLHVCYTYTHVAEVCSMSLCDAPDSLSSACLSSSYMLLQLYISLHC
jgi:ankyrin repeat protein